MYKFRMVNCLMMFSFLIIQSCVFTIDQAPRTTVELWKKSNTNIKQTIVDIEACGLSPDRNTDLPRNQYLIGALCLESKGYQYMGSVRDGICNTTQHKEFKACGGSRLD